MISFRLINALVNFQGYINKIIAEKLNIFILTYLDNILIYSKDDRDGHVAAVCWVLQQLRKYLLYVNPKRYRFYQEEIWFFDYVVSSKAIRIEDKKIKTVK